MNMLSTIVPKSDQMNADDLIGGSRTIKVTRVSLLGEAEQPVAVNFEGDAGKPFKPCKSMRRVMVALWGPDANAYAGRSMTLYRDPSVLWGGQQVGGIRISHMSDIEKPVTMALTATKASRKPYTVQPLVVTADKSEEVAQGIIARIQAATDRPTLEAITSEGTVAKQRQWMAGKRPDLAAKVSDAITSALARLEPPTEDEGADLSDDLPSDDRGDAYEGSGA